MSRQYATISLGGLGAAMIGSSCRTSGPDDGLPAVIDYVDLGEDEALMEARVPEA